MKKLLILIAMVFVLSLSFANAYDLEIVSLKTQGDLVAKNDVTFDIRVRNTGELYNASEVSTDITLSLGDGTTKVFPLTKNMNINSVEQFTFKKSYDLKGEYLTSAELSVPNNNNDTNSSNNRAELNVTIGNSAPVIEAIPDQEVVDGNNFQYTIKASDVDSQDVLTYKVESLGLADKIFVSTDGVISYLNAKEFGNQNVVVTVSDGTVSVTEEFNLKVRVNSPSFSFATEELNIDASSDSRTDTIQRTFEITNDGTQTLEAFTVDIDFDNDYEARVSFSSGSLAPSEKRTGVLFITIPEDQDSEKTQIGEIKIEAKGTEINVTKTIDVTLETESKLKITNIEISNDDDEDTSVKDGNTIDWIKEGDTLDFIITVENKYSEDDEEDRDMDRVYLEIEPNRDWFEDETTERITVDADSEEDIKISIDLDQDISNDKTSVKFKLYGRDGEYGFTHYDEWEINLEIDREKHEIRIVSSSIVGSSAYGSSQDINYISCEDLSATIQIELKNAGQDDENEVMLRVTSDDLDFSSNKADLEIDEGDSERYTVSFEIPENLRESKLYSYTVKAYYDNDELTDSETYLVQYVCDDTQSSTTTDEKEDDTSSGITSTPNTNTNTNTNSNTGSTNQNSNTMISSEAKGTFTAFRNSDSYILVLLILVVVLLIVIAVMASGLGKKKSRR